MNKCLGCHHNIKEPYYFCSYTCAVYCGYYSVTRGWLKDPSKITQEEIDNFLNKSPIRGDYPDKDKFL
jgi:hypothetical protein